MTNELRIKATKILMKSDLTVDEIADIHEAMCQDGAIEFLQKAKGICDNTHPCADECPLNGWCHHEDDMNEADLVRKVMEYQLPTDEFDGKAERNQAMIEMFDVCDTCEDNQVMDCVYIENDDRKSCPKYRLEDRDGNN